MDRGLTATEIVERQRQIERAIWKQEYRVMRDAQRHLNRVWEVWHLDTLEAEGLHTEALAFALSL